MPASNGFVWQRIAKQPTLGSRSSRQYSPERSARSATGWIEPGDESHHDRGAATASVGLAPDLEHIVELAGLDLVHLYPPPRLALADAVFPVRLLSAIQARGPADRLDLAWQSGLRHHAPARAGADAVFQGRGRRGSGQGRAAGLQGLQYPPGFAHPRSASVESDRRGQDRHDFAGVWVSPFEGAEDRERR